MADKGAFEEFLEGVAKDYEMKSIVEHSRNRSGKIDVAKATGIAMGLGYTSMDDLATFGAVLGASGAFDGKKRSSSGTGIYSPYNNNQELEMPEWRYKHETEDERKGTKYFIRFIVFLICLTAGITIIGMIATPKKIGIGIILLTVIGIVGYYLISRAVKDRDTKLAELEKLYRYTKQAEEQKQKDAERLQKEAEMLQKEAEKTAVHITQQDNEQPTVSAEPTDEPNANTVGDKTGTPDFRQISSFEVTHYPVRSYYEDDSVVDGEFIAGEYIDSEEMTLLRDAGYDALDLELMDNDERREALEDAGIDPDQYVFWE